MSRSRAVIFTARVAAFAGATAIAFAVPLLGVTTVSAADPAAPTTSPTATTNGDDWIG
jgi:hypothetical protein